MWIYEKKLQFPIKITEPDARLAKIMIEQYGGADGELGASLRYLSQKFSMVTPEAKATLNDIATEESVCHIYLSWYTEKAALSDSLMREHFQVSVETKKKSECLSISIGSYVHNLPFPQTLNVYKFYKPVFLSLSLALC